MRRTLALLAGTALLTGCGGGSHDLADGPSPAPPASSPAPPSTAATAPVHETAKQFIRRWQKTADAMQMSGDITAFTALNEPACKSCSEFVAGVQRIYEAGGHIEARATRILWIRPYAQALHDADATYQVRENTLPSRYQESSTGAWKTFPGGTDTQIFYLDQSTSGWKLIEYGQLAGSAS